ncbi:hypothetical protein VM95_11715 [Streptomyces rubellomurinus]|uniref:Uncharacterized protein n=2 Tax=Streptomyces rubellomurinus (strain ATCC 31215) TaxID=359131 RepID=A0A0F2TFL3_STRR3|nr:hypothetical protein VM95_11715 [Streptomyces rubellomurinus]
MREIQDDREKAIVPLAAIMTERRRLKDLLAETEAPYGRAYAAAEAAGWSAEELSRLGAEAPTRRPKGRPRKHASAANNAIPVPSSGDTEAAAAAVHSPAD